MPPLAHGLSLGIPWRHSGGPAAFSPGDLDPYLWVAPDDSSTVVQAADVLDSIANKGSAGNVFSQAVAINKPSWSPDFAVRSIRFLASASWLVYQGTLGALGAMLNATAGPSHELWARVRTQVSPTAGFSRAWLSSTNAAATRFRLGLLPIVTGGGNDFNVQVFNTSQRVSISANGVVVNTSYTLRSRYLTTADGGGASGTEELYANGVLLGSDLTANGGGTSWSDPMTLGSALGQIYQGYIGQLVGIARPLTVDEVSNMVDYFDQFLV